MWSASVYKVSDAVTFDVLTSEIYSHTHRDRQTDRETDRQTADIDTWCRSVDS